jgi:isopropylmalate/homocitrate/citramalate synthase
MCFSDTCGVFTPEAVDYYIPEMVKMLGDTPMTAHFHNDFGLGAINTVRALAHGALYAGVTANGIGERAGNTSLHQVVMVLRNLYGVEIPGFRYDMLMELRRTIEIFSGIPIQPHEPIVGEGVYSHESGIHTAGISIHPAIYQFIREKDVGGTQKFIFGKHSGAAAIESVLARHEKAMKDAGIEITPELIKKLLDRAKDLREEMTPKDGYNQIIGSYYSHYRSLGISEERLIEMLLEMKE